MVAIVETTRTTLWQHWIMPGERFESMTSTVDRVRDSKSSLFWRAISRRSTTPAWEEIMRRFSWRITVFIRQCHGHVPVRDGGATWSALSRHKRGSGEHSTLHAARQGRTADVGRAAFSQGSKSETDHLRYTFTFENGWEVCKYPSNSTHHKDKLNVLADLKRLRGLPKKTTPMFFSCVKAGTT